MLNDLETVKKELFERLASKTKDLSEKSDNQLAISFAVVFEELIRIELRMRALAEASRRSMASGFAGLSSADHAAATLLAIADGSELP
jgi:hypothetical protein